MLDINASAVLTQAIAFVLLVLFLGKFVFTPIGAQIDARQREIQDTLDQIASDRKAMEQTRSEYEQRLANIAEEAREHSAREIHRAQEEAAESSTYKDRALSEIEQERKKAVAQIRAEMADLAVIAASKILEKEIDPKVHRDLINNVISSVGSPAVRS
jgi:F-type H+-transporting ATPase subunit b